MKIRQLTASFRPVKHLDMPDDQGKVYKTYFNWIWNIKKWRIKASKKEFTGSVDTGFETFSSRTVQVGPFVWDKKLKFPDED